MEKKNSKKQRCEKFQLQLENLIKEIMAKEQLRSPRQVFERYPELGAEYTAACIANNNEEKCL
jgi:hypothetical protein